MTVRTRLRPRADSSRTLLAAALLFTAPACGVLSLFSSDPPPRPKEPGAIDPTPWLPADADLLVKIDLEQIAQSPYSGLLERSARAGVQALSFRAGILADPRLPEILAHAREAYAAVAFDGTRAPEVTVVVDVRKPVVENGQEALVGDGRAVQIDARTVLLSSRSSPQSGQRWRLPFNDESLVQFEADAKALREWVGAPANHREPLARAARVRGELRASYGIAVFLAFEHAPELPAGMMHGVLEAWLERLREDSVMRTMGLYGALMRTRVEPGERSSALVLTAEPPDSELVGAEIDKGIAEMAKAAQFGSVEEYLVSRATPGERAWDEMTCEMLEWIYAMYSRYEQRGDFTYYDESTGQYVQVRAVDVRAKAQQARYMLDAKCSFRTK